MVLGIIGVQFISMSCVMCSCFVSSALTHPPVHFLLGQCPSSSCLYGRRVSVQAHIDDTFDVHSRDSSQSPLPTPRVACLFRLLWSQGRVQNEAMPHGLMKCRVWYYGRCHSGSMVLGSDHKACQRMSSLDGFVRDIHSSNLVDGSYSAHRVPPRTKKQILFLLMGQGPPRGVMAVLGDTANMAVAGLAVKPGISSCYCFGSCLVVAPLVHLFINTKAHETT